MKTSLCCNEPVLVAGGVGLGATRWHQCRKCLQATDPVDWKARAIAAETLLDELNDAFDAARKEGSARRVPAEEVKRAYFEGFGGTKCFGHGDYRTSDEEWPTSRAKRVAEGRE